MDKAWLELKGIRPVMLLLAALSLLQGAAVIAQAVFLAKAVTILFDKNPLVMAWPSLALFFAAFAMRHTMIWLQRRTAGRFAEVSRRFLTGASACTFVRTGAGFCSAGRQWQVGDASTGRHGSFSHVFGTVHSSND